MKNINLSQLEGKKIQVLIDKADKLSKEDLEGKIHAHKIYNLILDQTPTVYDVNNYHVLRGILRQKIWNCERNFFWNEKFFSQSGQDKILKNHFFYDKKKGFFVEIGAYDGITGSNCFYFESMQLWEGIAIEASKIQFNKLEKNRKCKLFNEAMSSTENVVNFIEVQEGLTQMSGINNDNYTAKEIIKKDPNSKTNEYELKTVTFEEIVPSDIIIDYLSIDIEGGEMDILQSIDFNKFKIKVISVENNRPDKVNFDLFFRKKNFSFFDRIGQDEIFFNNKFFKLR